MRFRPKKLDAKIIKFEGDNIVTIVVSVSGTALKDLMKYWLTKREEEKSLLSRTTHLK